MNATLRKLAASVVFVYADGTEAQTLVGTDFILDKNEKGFSLGIDLAGNLASRNRGLLCYYEAQGLQRQHAQVKTIRLNDKELALSLSRELGSATALEINVALGEEHFSYQAAADISGRTVILTVQPAA